MLTPTVPATTPIQWGCWLALAFACVCPFSFALALAFAFAFAFALVGFLQRALGSVVPILMALEASYICKGVNLLLIWRGFSRLLGSFRCIRPAGGIVQVHCLFPSRRFSVESLTAGLLLEFHQESFEG